MNHMKDFLCQQQEMRDISIPSLEQREAGTEVLRNISRPQITIDANHSISEILSQSY